MVMHRHPHGDRAWLCLLLTACRNTGEPFCHSQENFVHMHLCESFQSAGNHRDWAVRYNYPECVSLTNGLYNSNYITKSSARDAGSHEFKCM